MSDTDAPNTPDASDSTGSAFIAVDKLTRAQVFSKDVEETTREDLDFIIDELRKINARNRKAREDDAILAESLTKIKKANVATRKKKATPTTPTDLMDTKI
jgi:hypothetical protein|tara:strand:- start:432 stop:734 length:303 start_codon:yes stop_codon:yes gene_type:complete